MATRVRGEIIRGGVFRGYKRASGLASLILSRPDGGAGRA